MKKQAGEIARDIARQIARERQRDEAGEKKSLMILMKICHFNTYYW